MVVDLEAWRRLRATLEERWLAGAPPSGSAECGGDANAYVICEGPYIVHLPTHGEPAESRCGAGDRDRLIRVAINGALPEAEVWIDDIRLRNSVADLGKAIALDARLAAADVGTSHSPISARRTVPADRADSELPHDGNGPPVVELAARSLSAAVARTRDAALAHLHADGGGSAAHRRHGHPRRLASRSPPPALVEQRLCADGAPEPAGNQLDHPRLVDPLTLTGNVIRGRTRTELSRAATSSWNANASYTLVLQRHGPLLNLSGILPRFLRETETGKALSATRISLVPATVRLVSGLSRDEGQFNAYPVAVIRPIDVALPPTLSLNHVWRNTAALGWQPLGMLTLNGDLTSTRDLRNYADSTALDVSPASPGRPSSAPTWASSATASSHEPQRDASAHQLAASQVHVPEQLHAVAEPHEPRAGSRADRRLDRRLHPAADAHNSRANELGASLDVARLVRGIAGDSSALTPMFSRMRPVDLTAASCAIDVRLAAFHAPLHTSSASAGARIPQVRRYFCARRGRDAHESDLERRRLPSA